MEYKLKEEFKLEKEDFQPEDIYFQDEEIWTFRSSIPPHALKYPGIRFLRDDGSEIKYGWSDEFTCIIDYRGKPQGIVTGSVDKGFIWKIYDGIFRDIIITYLTDENYKKYMEEFKKKLIDFLEELEEEEQKWKKMKYNTDYISKLIANMGEYISLPSYIIIFMEELMRSNQAREKEEYNKKLNITKEDYQIPPDDDICDGLEKILESCGIKCNRVEKNEYDNILNITEEDYQIHPRDDIYEELKKFLKSCKQKK